MTPVRLELARDLEVRLRPHERAVFRLAVRLVVRDALVLNVRHGAVDDRFGGTAGRIGERHRVLDLVLVVVNAGEDEDADNVRALLGDPISPVLKVEPRLERCLRGGKKKNARQRSRKYSDEGSSLELTDAIWMPVLLFFQLAMPSST